MNQYHNLGYCNATTSLLSLFPFIPFPPSLLHPLSSQVEGTFLLDVPPVLLGYEHPSSLVTTQTLTSDLKSSGHTHLQLFIALEPPLSVLPPIKDQVGMNQACITLDTKLVIPVSAASYLPIHITHLVCLPPFLPASLPPSLPPSLPTFLLPPYLSTSLPPSFLFSPLLLSFLSLSPSLPSSFSSFLFSFPLPLLSFLHQVPISTSLTHQTPP